MQRYNINFSANFVFSVIIFITLLITGTINSQINEIPFYPNGIYDEKIPTPASVIGFEIGEKPVRYSDVYLYFNTLADKSERVRIIESGQTYEGRKLFYLMISSPENILKLDEIKINLAKLSDVRKLTA